MHFERWQELWQYRELFYFLVWRNIKIRYKQTVLGASWAIIQPLFTMIIFTFFFGRLARMPSDGVPYPIFSYSALLFWTYFAATLNQSGNSLVTNTNLITKVYFPRVALPASSALSGLVDLALASIVLIGMMVYYKIAPSWGIIFWPILVIPLVLLALGFGMIFAALNVRYRDVKHILPFIVQIWLFLTPIIYPTSIIPDKFKILLVINPVAGIIEAFRASILPARHMDWGLLATSVAITLLVFVLGMLYFRSTEKHFADII
jgi:lipopolysaccharide transport system permease protein